MKITPLFICVGALVPAFGQTSGAILTAAGYSAPAPPQVAPGQVTTFFFRGIGPLPDGHLRSADAPTTPLPTNLAGVSLGIAQGQGNAVPVPLFSVRQESDCDSATEVNPACLLTSVKIEIPFELAAEATATPAAAARLTLAVDGQAGRAFPLQPVPDNAHVVTSCDISGDTKYTSVCDRQAYHGDARPVTRFEPARRGETLVVYAYGLGQGSPRVPTGDVAMGSVLENLPGRVKASFDNFVNALSSGPRFFSPDIPKAVSPITFGGLTSGLVGLYQLSIPVPLSLDLALACGPEGPIRSNANLYITTSQGTETIALCVQL